MSKVPTFPVLFENCRTFNISDLKLWEYLKPNQTKTGFVTWNKGGVNEANICITVKTNTKTPNIEFGYNCNGNPVKYTVNLVSIPSNLGKGVVWFFVCPVIGKRCRKLYLVNNYFLHRSAIKGCMYEKQTQSHKTRETLKQFETIKILEILESKFFKQYYLGKPTRKYLKLIGKYKKVAPYLMK